MGSCPVGNGGRGVGVARGGGGWLVSMLGVGGVVGDWGCESRIEGIVQCTKRYCTILRKNEKKMWGRRRGNMYSQCILRKMKTKKNKKK